MPAAAPLRPHLRRAPLGSALRRRPALWWAVTLVLAGTSATVVGGAVSRAEVAADRFGRTQPVLVATRDLAPGAVVDPGVTELREVPAAFVPPGAADADALGRRVTATVRAGEVVHGARVAPGGLSAVAALLPPGTRGVAVPTAPGGLSLEVGDVVDVLATSADDVVPPTVTVASGTVVVAVAEDAVTVAVDAGDVARVAYALSTGLATLVLVGG